MRTLCLILLYVAAGLAQGTPSDCTFPSSGSDTFTAVATGTSYSNSNSFAPCRAFEISYNTSGISGISIQFETSPDNSSWTAVPNTVCSSSVQPPCVLDGANPSTTLGNQTFSVKAYGRFVRLNVTTFTGTGSISTKMYGYKGLSAKSGGGSGGGGGGATGFVLLESHTASNSAELDFTASITSTYDIYEIDVVNLVPANNGDALLMQFSTNGGASWDTAAHYVWNELVMIPAGTGSAGANPDTALHVFSNESLTGHFNVSGTMKLFGPLNGVVFPMYTGLFQGADTASDPRPIGELSGGNYNQTTAVNAFRILFSTGNITSGTVRCYGLSH